MARRMAQALLNLGFVKGDRIGILSKNCAEWFISDLSIMMAGMISVPIYPTANRGTISYVLDKSDCKAVFVGKLDNLMESDAGIPSKIKKITLPYPTISGQHTWNDLLKTEPLEIINSANADETMSIAFTSGSTGKPKGVVLSLSLIHI